MPHDIYVAVVGASIDRVQAAVAPHSIQFEPTRPFCRVPWDAFEAPSDRLKDLSVSLQTDVLWLATQKQVDLFAFQRWVAGEPRRRLTYGVGHERTWEELDGTPEPWESDVLFSAKQLDRKLRVLNALDVPNKEATERELHRIWSGRVLQVGSNEPAVNAATVGPAIARYYNLPGWE